ncbi:hypothetical protein HanRHA438_Chr11g0508441 [Helianthus annuus]|uniref:Uncharacterized protein n=1 Tax=Helianthus annuus TaxID=4232 RepID=A0A9K3N0G3_HELAN|nr:hypothetical protein HanXRQr2_Chr11g0495831 [Helianthus annuus]KAJ0871111.1 hypothetical protein HanRHA438_Chr11g0508441 [Helianthus annuus]KAJ0875560.1 hypothetical protein HanPSC8_Chr11g0477841 [Helianthus annuus]
MSIHNICSFEKKKHLPLLPLLFLLLDEENPNFKTLVTSFIFCFPLSFPSSGDREAPMDTHLNPPPLFHTLTL